MRRETIGGCELYPGTMEETIGEVRADHILTDPPYLYLKTHDFDREFDERLLFESAKRFLPDDGFIALFGRGTSFYRWNTTLAEPGFVFKEEIVWDKMRPSGMASALSRVHETVSLFTKKNGTLNSPRIPYTEMKGHDPDSVMADIRNLSLKLGRPEGIEKLKKTLEEKKTGPERRNASKFGVSFAKDRLGRDSACHRLLMIENGMREKSVIRLGRQHYSNVHPTQKPVRLAERILALISEPGDTIYDPFMGSGSFGVACVNTGRKYVGSEMKGEYFEIACKRIEAATAQGKLAFE